MGQLPIAAGCRLTPAALLGKRITGALQMADPLDYATLCQILGQPAGLFDELLAQFVKCGLLERRGSYYSKTVAGFFFIEEMLKPILDRVVTPFDIKTSFLGRDQIQTVQALRRASTQ
jgi:hypothetical protein